MKYPRQAYWSHIAHHLVCTSPRPDERLLQGCLFGYELLGGANHGVIAYGHIGADMLTLCSILRIPVSMHNIQDKDIFRPAAWNAFGMDKEGADYRACQNFGPIYK